MQPAKHGTGRRGRPRAGERKAREQAILDAAHEALIEHGYEGVSMIDIAQRAGCSKETLYAWFTHREGLFTRLIERNAERSLAELETQLDAPGDAQQCLNDYAYRLLTLLSGPASVALNRAAMQSPELATRLLSAGRHRAGPLVERYLRALHEQGLIACNDTTEAFEVFYGLAVRDTQIRVLLGETPPNEAHRRARAERAVAQFFVLYAPRREPTEAASGSPSA